MIHSYYQSSRGPSIWDVGIFSQIFDPNPSTVGSSLVLSVGKFGQFLTPPPLKHADILNGWSLTLNQLAHVDGEFCITLVFMEILHQIVFLQAENWDPENPPLI